MRELETINIFDDGNNVTWIGVTDLHKPFYTPSLYAIVIINHTS